MTDVIYLVGAERSGTNYLQWLLKENFKKIIVLTLYKHYSPRGIVSKIDWPNFQGLSDELKKEARKFSQEVAIQGKGLPPFAFVSDDIQAPAKNKKSKEIEKTVFKSLENGTVKFLVNVKNPYGWHISYSKHWSHIPFPTAMKHWQDMYHDWAVFHDENPNITHICRHEDVLKDFKGFLTDIKTKFSLTQKNSEFVTVNKVLTTITHTKNKPYKRANYFINEEYVPGLQKNQQNKLEKCKKILDKDLVERFGYKIL